MRYEDMKYTIPKCGLLQSRHVYLLEGEVYECIITEARKDYLLAHYYLLIPSTEENVRKSLEWAEKAQAAGGNAGVLLEEARKRLGEFRKEEKKKKGLFGRKR